VHEDISRRTWGENMERGKSMERIMGMRERIKREEEREKGTKPSWGGKGGEKKKKY